MLRMTVTDAQMTEQGAQDNGAFIFRGSDPLDPAQKWGKPQPQGRFRLTRVRCPIQLVE